MCGLGQAGLVRPPVAIEGIRVLEGKEGGGVARPFHPISRRREEGREGGRTDGWMVRSSARRDVGNFSQPPFTPDPLLPVDTMAQQSVTRVTGRRSGCHHKTFQLVIANINVAAPAHARCRADSHARTTRRSHTPVKHASARARDTHFVVST